MMNPTKDERGDESQAFLALPGDDTSNDGRPVLLSERPTWRRYLRLAIEFGMALAIVFLLFRPPQMFCRRGGMRSPVPDFPLKTYTYVQNKRYVDEDMFASNETTLRTLHNWIELSAKARGYVQIPDRAAYDLPEPYTVAISRDTQGPAYMVSVFHQLHCLSYIVEHYQAGYGGVELTKEIAHHSAHCFDYLRQSIMCAADTNLEGKTEAGPGWGSDHQCKDYDAVLKWANDHGAMPWRNELMPGDTTL
ncbi:hypothetical protein QBC47DRAFT_460149 [Echria macrotheca]|uniref:Oxidase ustYa n=1 Tax=Echria macrotheca TaxID=438768 RepID=A0AAJ0F727_9PEZI|nr:hypothetical protein QBC47DRAFT_460149 [Echria macrotheca]